MLTPFCSVRNSCICSSMWSAAMVYDFPHHAPMIHRRYLRVCEFTRKEDKNRKQIITKELFDFTIFTFHFQCVHFGSSSTTQFHVLWLLILTQTNRFRTKNPEKANKSHVEEINKRKQTFTHLVDYRLARQRAAPDRLLLMWLQNWILNLFAAVIGHSSALVGNLLELCYCCVFWINRWRRTTKRPTRIGFSIWIWNLAFCTVYVSVPRWFPDELYLSLGICRSPLLCLRMWMCVITSRRINFQNPTEKYKEKNTKS